jgi:hypothetical protein
MTHPGAQNARNAHSDQGTRSTTRSTGCRQLRRTLVTLRNRSALPSLHGRPSGRLACPCSSASSGTEVPVICLDSSAMVKLLAREAGSGLAAQLRDGCDTAVASRLAYPEVRAALAAGRNHDPGPGGQAAAEQAREQS